MQRFVDARPFIVYLITKQSGCESDKRILVKALERGCFIVSDGRYLLKPTVSLTYGDHMRKPFHGSLDVCLFTKCLLPGMYWRRFTLFGICIACVHSVCLNYDIWRARECVCMCSWVCLCVYFIRILMSVLYSHR
jgi:hypothetical protein